MKYYIKFVILLVGLLIFSIIQDIHHGNMFLAFFDALFAYLLFMVNLKDEFYE